VRSPDDVAGHLGGFGDPVRYVRQENQGVAAARNHAVRLATQEFIAFLDADDVWHPRKLELQLDVFAKEPRLGLLGTRQVEWPGTGFEPLPEARSVTAISWERLTVGNCMVTSSLLARRQALDRAGEFDTRLRSSSDYDLWLRVAEAAPVAILELGLTGYRDSPGSLSKQAFAVERAKRLILHKLDQRGVWRGRRLLRAKAYSYVHHACAYVHGEAGNRATALLRSVQSLLRFPFPFRPGEVKSRLERPKRLVRNALALLR
jgi:glycosyltransferase involved in cell wall biosynthesis